MVDFDKLARIIEDIEERLRRADLEYNSPSPLSQIASMWNIYLNGLMPMRTKLSAVDVCCMMTLLKMVRVSNYTEGTEHYRDSLLDGAGYLVLALGQAEAETKPELC